MAKCKNDTFLNMVSYNPVSKGSVLTFRVKDALPDCKKILTDAYVDITGLQSFRRSLKPKNRFECDAYGCLSGTLFLAAEGSATYKAGFNATEFADGVITLYVKPETAGAGEVTVTIGSEAGLTNADVFKASYTQADITDDGFVPVVIDLSKTPASTIPEEDGGWQPSASGAYIKVETSVAAGISSISIFDDVADFAIDNVVQFMCLSGLDGSDDLDALESECASAGYDTSDTSTVERTVTGKLMTPNAWLLNPRAGKGDKEQGFAMTTEKFTVTADANGNAVVVIADKADDECGYVKAQVADSCDVVDSELELLSIPQIVDLEENQYQVVDGEDGATNVVFNNIMIGEEVVITYPRRVRVANHHVYSIENVGSRTVDMTYEKEYSDGTIEVWVYHNVLLTSVPMGITNEETEMEFTIAIPKNANGVD